ncbi:XrtB/PEP-CTERM-associated transcriptional regulator EpsA [Candidatus Symbiobacter mobilis]|uniref:DNA-binding HTH domain protein n=1 Tax=Candidatus Symbiobacter mobilis CR TaxID=946483 RepID=U5NB55_9BURK|nr:XrtB/PEP-CTERM-associated transcriptional regulator EpsA [Candidatus Symbiobacter mobilis]AGX87463.1 DNA-binding HTH domain protein [Candidatus Symbiobacter mobilis CR]
MPDPASSASVAWRDYPRCIAGAARVRTHRDLLDWLQGDFRSFLPHDVLLAAWGDYGAGERFLIHDILSPHERARTQNVQPQEINETLRALYAAWCAAGRLPVIDPPRVAKMGGEQWPAVLGGYVEIVPAMLVHGHSDKRHQYDCLYVALRWQGKFAEQDRETMLVLTPVVDAALRQVELLASQRLAAAEISGREIPALSDREREVLHWVMVGKTNVEIGLILQISEFTVKNHLKRIFSKLAVSNRAQAVGKLRSIGGL